MASVVGLDLRSTEFQSRGRLSVHDPVNFRRPAVRIAWLGAPWENTAPPIGLQADVTGLLQRQSAMLAASPSHPSIC